MALAALANIAAALAAGYSEIVRDNGNAADANRFTVTLEIPTVGDPDGGSGKLLQAYGQGATQVAAEAVALAALNQQRLVRYGADTGTVSVGKRASNAHTRDKT